MSNQDSGRGDGADVVVVGGGVAGLCAAIAAHDSGAKTLLCEASAQIGGTASWSGGAAWIPMNGRMREAGVPDRAEDALAYMRVCAEGANEALCMTFLEQAAAIADYLQSTTPLELEMGTMPDYQGGMPGGVYATDRSRSMSPAIFDTNRLGAHRNTLRRSPYGTVPFSFQEFAKFDAVVHPERIDAALFGQRLQQGYVGWGEALIGALFLGALERGIEILVDTRVVRLLANGRVHGVVAESGGRELNIAARRGVVLACGGYEWDPELVAQNFSGLEWLPSTVPTNRGDGWRMGQQVDAAMGNEGRCWGWPSYLIPGELQADGTPLVRTCLVERCLPHLIMIDRHGERFVDESLPYHRILKTMIERDGTDNYRHLPAWHVFDQQFRDKYTFGPVAPGAPTPAWMRSFASLDALADAIGVPHDRLARTVQRFNDDVRSGKDRQFQRGEQPYGRFWGDRDNPHGSCLGTLEKPPYFAVEALPSTIGTCGGPRIDTSARVLREDGIPVPGLYAAGNVTSAVSGPSYFGPGGTIGPAMVFGVIGGRAAAANRN